MLVETGVLLFSRIFKSVCDCLPVRLLFVSIFSIFLLKTPFLSCAYTQKIQRPFKDVQIAEELENGEWDVLLGGDV